VAHPQTQRGLQEAVPFQGGPQRRVSISGPRSGPVSTNMLILELPFYAEYDCREFADEGTSLRPGAQRSGTDIACPTSQHLAAVKRDPQAELRPSRVRQTTRPRSHAASHSSRRSSCDPSRQEQATREKTHSERRGWERRAWGRARRRRSA
jgi:hypothetical protein